MRVNVWVRLRSCAHTHLSVIALIHTYTSEHDIAFVYYVHMWAWSCLGVHTPVNVAVFMCAFTCGCDSTLVYVRLWIIMKLMCTYMWTCSRCCARHTYQHWCVHTHVGIIGLSTHVRTCTGMFTPVCAYAHEHRCIRLVQTRTPCLPHPCIASQQITVSMRLAHAKMLCFDSSSFVVCYNCSCTQSLGLHGDNQPRSWKCNVLAQILSW